MQTRSSRPAGLGANSASTSAKAVEAADTIGTLHFARFVALNETTLAFISEYDGDLRDYVMDFTKHLGPIFDLVFARVIDPPPTPIAKNADALIEWTKAHDLEPLSFYSAYPLLRVQDIKAQAMALEQAGESS
jgi:hypothetical protein